MNRSLDQPKLNAAALAGRLEWRKHVLQRLAERSITLDAVLQTLAEGERLEDYPEDRPYPSALFMAWADNRPLHVVAAFDEDNNWAYVITAYEPDLEHFEGDYKTRRRV